jgi:hypothetical protein
MAASENDYCRDFLGTLDRSQSDLSMFLATLLVSTGPRPAHSRSALPRRKRLYGFTGRNRAAGGAVTVILERLQRAEQAGLQLRQQVEALDQAADLFPASQDPPGGVVE